MQAMDFLKHLDWSTRINTIYQRLRYGHLKAIARRANHDDTSAEFEPISTKLWERSESIIGETDLWTAGDMTIAFQASTKDFGQTIKKLALFGVRFDPAGLAEFIPQFALKHTIALRNEVTTIGIPDAVLEIIREKYPAEASSESKVENRPPASDAHLKLWLELYRKIYVGNEDTAAKAVASAKGMFPDKSVARDRVRDLFPDRQQGRKPKGSAN